MGDSTHRAVARRRLLVAVASALALACGFVLVSCGSDDDAGAVTETTTTDATQTTQTTTEPPPPPPGPTEVRVRVVDGVPRGGIVRETVDQGDRVAFVVTSDVSDHVHVHGYDLVRDVGPGQRARIVFRARLPGRFVIELEDRHTQIAELTVRP